MTETTTPLVVLGLDVGDADEIVRLAQAGCLPTIAALMGQGCWGAFSGKEMVCELGTWVSLMSGVSRQQHGYYYFRQLKPRTYDLEIVNALTVKNAPPFWAHLRQTPLKVAVIDVPDTQPVAGLRGLQVSDWATHYNLLPPSTEPAHLLGEVRRVFGPQISLLEKLNTTFEQDYRIYQRLLNRVEKKGQLIRHLLAQDQFDLITAVFAETHTGGHQFWRYRPEAQPPYPGPENALTHAIRNLYQAIDLQLGLILKQLPANANVVIMSGTGLEDQYPTEKLVEDFCRKLGYQASPQRTAPATPMALLRNLLPEKLRAFLSRPLPRTLQERWISDKYRSGTDWSKTTAFAIPSYYAGFLRVNLKGREPQGTVEPGADYDALLQRLTDDLRQLVDPVTNEPALAYVDWTAELFGGGPPLCLPDLVFGFRPAAHWRQHLAHPRATITQPRPGFFRGSDHTRTGFFASAGPSIRASGNLGLLSPIDLAPTLLTLLKVPVPDNVDGQVMNLLLG